ncbi:anti-sigma factor family protein [Corynebacterium provencense]|uniref:anti-sigma factor family protein n=1 Tax=Corynebacterium provencense TaxID=1737425 RepID=UPI00082C476B|nr:zf-HC2 domain-containing protein [Corynebacterium provencense]
MWHGRDVGHLSTEAVAALVDGELSRVAEDRAKAHLVHCGECRSEVRAQRQAVDRMRRAGALQEVHAPGSLLARLTGIPASCGDSPDEPPGESTVGVDGCRRPETFGDRLSTTVRRALRVSHTGRGRR